MVRHLQPPARCLPRGGSLRPSLLVRRVRPGVGDPSTGPVRFGPLILGGTLPVDKPSGASCDPPGSISLPSPSAGSCRGLVRGQHHLAFVCQEARGVGGGGGWGDFLPGSQRGGPPTSPSLGRGVGDHFGSPIHYGGPECNRQLLESPTPGPGVRVDACPGHSQLSPGSVAGHRRPVRHL